MRLRRVSWEPGIRSGRPAMRIPGAIMRTFRDTVLFLAAAAGAFSAGCSVKPRPPAYSLYDPQRLIVLPFENHSLDPAPWAGRCRTA